MEGKAAGSNEGGQGQGFVERHIESFSRHRRMDYTAHSAVAVRDRPDREQDSAKAARSIWGIFWFEQRDDPGDEMKDDIGRLATREYEVTLPDGAQGKLAFALCDLSRENALARHARKREAVAFGLLGFENLPDAPQHPLLWVRTRSGMEMTTSDGDDQPGADLQRLVARHFIAFFADIEDVVPELATLPFHLKDRQQC